MVRLRIRQTEAEISSPIACGSGGPAAEYNLPLHVGALFVILFVSATGCSFALLVTKIPKLRIPPTFLFIVRHFGTGVLIATAFVHLLPTAFISLTDPCLPPFWNEDYPAMAGAIALVAVFFITVIEMIFSPGRHACAANVTELTRSVGTTTQRGEKQATAAAAAARQSGEVSEDLPKGPLYGKSVSGRSQSIGREFSRVAAQNHADVDQIEMTGVDPAAAAAAADSSSPGQTHSADDGDYDDITAEKEAIEKRKKALMQCVMLEMGILFHSVFIGMALAVATGNDQIVLLIAIVFHRLALGSRIAAVGWKPKAIQPWVMALLYGCTTPLGQAIGIGTRNLYDPDSQTGLLVVGLMNAISSGFLTFNSLVDLLSEDFLSDDSWRDLRGRKRNIAFLLVIFGAFCMSLVGAWA